jgi:hypothetical protein
LERFWKYVKSGLRTKTQFTVDRKKSICTIDRTIKFGIELGIEGEKIKINAAQNPFIVSVTTHCRVVPYLTELF